MIIQGAIFRITLICTCSMRFCKSMEKISASANSIMIEIVA